MPFLYQCYFLEFFLTYYMSQMFQSISHDIRRYVNNTVQGERAMLNCLMQIIENNESLYLKLPLLLSHGNKPQNKIVLM